MGRRERFKEIWNCFYFGFLSSPFYEDNKHYECGYFVHLGRNLKYAWHLIRGGEEEQG